MYDIVANLIAGKGDGERCLKIVESYLTKNNIEFKTSIIPGRRTAQALTAELCKGGARKIVAIGGDGTFHEVLNGMDFSKARLGFVPAGRGNDFAQSAGISFNPEEAIKNIVLGKESELDYIQVGNRRCLNVCGTGLDVEVLRLTDSKKNTYVASLANLLLHYKPYTVQVENGGITKEYRCVMAALCNGTQFGGGIRLCPPAKFNDGKMNLLIVKKPAFPTILAMPAFVAGKHMNKSYVEHVVCDSAKITVTDSAAVELDGEIYDTNVLDGRIVPGGLKTFAEQPLDR